MPTKRKPVKSRENNAPFSPELFEEVLPTPPRLRWMQFEQPVLANLRAARESLASASGMSETDGFGIWAGEARELASRVHALVKKIEENQRRVLQESISGPEGGR